eukprot:740628-Ditylum_brightwellii.AAC.1
MKNVITFICDEYRLKHKPIIARNPQANSIVKRAHQTIGNLLHAFKIGTAKLDPDDPWGSILNA